MFFRILHLVPEDTAYHHFTIHFIDIELDPTGNEYVLVPGFIGSY